MQAKPSPVTPARRKRRPPRPARGLVPVEAFVALLRQAYVHDCELVAPSIAWMSRRSGVPYETLRHFLNDADAKHLLCPVNEEKLARALGHSSEHYRAFVRRWLRRKAWEQRLRAVLTALCWPLAGMQELNCLLLAGA